MELEELKQNWKQMDEHLSALKMENKELTRQVMNQKITTVCDKLKRKFMLGLVIVLMIPNLIHLNERVIGNSFNDSTWIALAVLCMAMVIRQIIWLRDLRGIDCLKQTVKEACVAEVKLRKHIKAGVGTCLLLVIPFFIFFFLDLQQWGNEPVMIGAACGLVLGLALGFYKLRKLFKDIDRLNRTLNEIKE